MSDLGVVDPLRAPGPVVDAVGRFRALPAVAQAFIGLMLVDAIARTFGLMEPRVRGDAFGLVASYVPRDAWILLPALVLIRRPSAPTDTQWVFRGALVVALLTLLEPQTGTIIGNAIPPDWVEPHVILGVLELVLTGLAFAVLGYGLANLNEQTPQASIAGLGNLAAFAVIGSLVIQLVASLAANSGPNQAFAVPWWPYAGAAVHALCLGYLLRAIVRGLGDPNRPDRATRLGTSGALVWALGLFIEGAFVAVQTLTHSLTLFLGDVTTVLGVLDVTGPLLIVGAFGLGLADPLRPMADEWAAALRSDPLVDPHADPRS